MLEEQLLATIRHSPDDTAHRLVYADWLEERGLVARSNLIALQCRLAPKLVPALDELAVRLAATRRRREHEAPAANTAAYIQLAFALGFARIGREDRARRLVAEATGTLVPVDGDGTHRVLIDVFAARVEQRLDGLPDDHPLPAQVAARVAEHDRVSRHAVSRMTQTVRAFLPRQSDQLDELDALTALAEPLARPRFARVIARIGNTPWLAARALTTAARFGWLDAATPLVATLRRQRTSLSPAVLGTALRALRRLGRGDDIAAMIAGIGDPTRDDELQLVVAGAQLSLGDEHDRGVFDRERLRLARVPERAETLRALAAGYAQVPVDFAIDRVLELAAIFERVTDKYATNTYFCITAVGFAAALVDMLADHGGP